MKTKITTFTLGLLCSVFFLLNSEPTKRLFSEVMVICAKGIAPSVFPFIVSSSILLAALKDTPLKIKIPLIYMFGLFFGFPVTASIASKMYARNEIGINTYKMLVCCCGIPSIGFTLGICSIRFGHTNAFYLYLTTVISAIICSSFFSYDVISRKSITCEQQYDISVLSELSAAIKDGIYRTITVCGYVIFFYILSGNICRITGNKYVTALVSGFLEFSTGCTKAFLLNDMASYILCAGILSFSGISVFMQCISIEKDNSARIIKKEYLVSHLCQGLLSCLIAFSVHINGGASIPLFSAVAIASIIISWGLQTVNKNKLKSGTKRSIIS